MENTGGIWSRYELPIDLLLIKLLIILLEIFSHSNRRFAAAYVKPNQRATLSASLLSGRRETIRFRAWEATRDLRLRVCCDSIDNSEGGICVFETDGGVRRGSRNWKEYTATCPRGTQKVGEQFA